MLLYNKPELSVTVQFTVVMPSEKVYGAAGMQANAAMPAPSKTVGAMGYEFSRYVVPPTGVYSHPLGQVIVGAVVSILTTLKLQVPVLPTDIKTKLTRRQTRN
jgi:hypothetical protein